MERLHFGARARRKARLERWARWAALASFIAMLAGISSPWMLAGFGTIDVTGTQASGIGFIGRGPAPRLALDSELSDVKHDSFGVEAPKPKPKPKPKPEVEEAPAPVEEEVVVEEETVAPAAPSGSISEIIYAAAARHGVDPGYLLSIAQCESGLNPNAVNSAGYYGLFQFDAGTWAANGYGSIYDPVAQARTAARLIAAGQASRWPSCS